MPWDIENYHIVDGRILYVEISIPLMEFLYTNIDDVKNAWNEVLGQFVSEDPDLEMSWEMQPCGENAIVTIRIAKPGDLEQFSASEAEVALGAIDALMEEQEKEPKPKKKTTAKTEQRKKTPAKPKKTKTAEKTKAKEKTKSKTQKSRSKTKTSKKKTTSKK